MNSAIRKGFGFGVTSGIITTLGMMVGLAFSTSSSIYVIAGIAVIAVTDALSDAVAIHVSEEAGHVETESNIWAEVIVTFLSKFLIALVFIIPVLAFPLNTAVVISAIIGLVIITIISFALGKIQKKSGWKVALEHLSVAILVIIVTGLIGRYIESVKSNYI